MSSHRITSQALIASAVSIEQASNEKSSAGQVSQHLCCGWDLASFTLPGLHTEIVAINFHATDPTSRTLKCVTHLLNLNPLTLGGQHKNTIWVGVIKCKVQDVLSEED